MPIPFPSLDDVKVATRYQLCFWHRFLPSPRTECESVVLTRLYDRWREMGGFTPEISKAIGWDR